MGKYKHIQQWIPEVYLLASAIFYWISTSSLFNPIAIFLVCVLTAIFIWKKKTLGLIVSFLFLMLSLYMVLALLSELGEFHHFNKDAKIMLAVGATWLGLNIILAVAMLRKWSKRQSTSNKVIIEEIA